ncbi:MAG: ROK family transcriptional regulator [Propionibacteriaceae bacterium]|nr:ROK family transcriptional regulator [Propionibacteriaceae bacterium]
MTRGHRTNRAGNSSITVTDAMIRAGQKSLRDHNLRLLLAHIRASDPANPLSRADLAEITGLTKATVSTLVTRLQASRLITDLPPTTSPGAGRPAIPWTLARRTVASLGLEINVDFLGVRAIDLTGETLLESFIKVNLRGSEPEDAFLALLREVHTVASQLRKDSVRLIGACLALPGIADHPYGPLRLAPNLGWHNIDIAQTLARSLDDLAQELDENDIDEAFSLMKKYLLAGVPVDNEANLAARTEIVTHPGESFIYVSGEIGIGSALVINGEAFVGLHGWAGELGHVCVNPDGPRCACGAQGCLEVYAGKHAIMATAGLAPDTDYGILLKAYARKDTKAQLAIGQASTALGIALSTCINLIDVNTIVLGGSFAPLAEALRDGVKVQLSRHVLSSHWAGQDFEVRASKSGPFPAATGAALMVLDRAVPDPDSALWREGL